METLNTVIRPAHRLRLEPTIAVDPFLAHIDAYRAVPASMGLRGAMVPPLPSMRHVPVLSVRSAWTTLLDVFALPRGAEVVLSAINSPCMFDAVARAGLEAVIVDVDPRTLLPTPRALERAISRRTGVVLVSHLFGTWSDLGIMADVCASRGVPLVEDAAHCYFGSGFEGSPDASVSLFSFGTLHRSAVGQGGVAIVRAPALRARLVDALERMPEVEEAETLRRLAKTLSLSPLGSPALFGAASALCSFAGRDLESILREAVGAVSEEDAHSRKDRRPSKLLAGLVARAWASRRFEAEWALSVRQMAHYRTLAQSHARSALEAALGNVVTLPGIEAQLHAFWIAPLALPDAPTALKFVALAQDCGVVGSRTTPHLEAHFSHDAPGAHALVEGMVYVSWKGLCALFEAFGASPEAGVERGAQGETRTLTPTGSG
jgi:hypothetical protein